MTVNEALDKLLYRHDSHWLNPCEVCRFCGKVQGYSHEKGCKGIEYMRVVRLAFAETPRTEARENEWLEDELMEVMRIVAKGMTDTHEDEIIYAMMVTAIRRLMEADTDKYEALFDRWQKRHAAVSPPRESHLCKMLKTGDANDCTCDPIGHPPQS